MLSNPVITLRFTPEEFQKIWDQESFQSWVEARMARVAEQNKQEIYELDPYYAEHEGSTDDGSFREFVSVHLYDLHKPSWLSEVETYTVLVSQKMGFLDLKVRIDPVVKGEFGRTLSEEEKHITACITAGDYDLTVGLLDFLSSWKRKKDQAETTAYLQDETGKAVEKSKEFLDAMDGVRRWGPT